MEGKTVTGWIVDSAWCGRPRPMAIAILFGAAIDSETKPAAATAAAAPIRTLCASTARLRFFPTSPLAGEGLYRAADIKWQMKSRCDDRPFRPRKRRSSARAWTNNP